MSMFPQTYWRKLASGRLTGPLDRFVLALLSPLGWLYSLGQQFRVLMYKCGLLKIFRLPRPVISIGNITVGGTGKTPAAARIARDLLARGYKVAVLSRGYGGSLEGRTCVVSDGKTIMLKAVECGDEPYLLASTIAGLIVVIGSDRYAAGQLAMQFMPDVFLLDDGFQHLRLHRDLNILLLDYSSPFGNGMILPAGLLRESIFAMRRSDLILFTRAPIKGATVNINTHGIPYCISSHTIADLVQLGTGRPLPVSEYKQKKIMAFAGIADPDLFFGGLRGLGLNLVHCISYPDHETYDEKRADELLDAMRTSGAELIVTTEKDGVKIKGLSRKLTSHMLLARLDLTIDSPVNLNSKLTELLQRNEVAVNEPAKNNLSRKVAKYAKKSKDII